MKVLSDLLAVILFFLTYTITKNMITATAVAVVFGILQAGFTYWKYKKLDTMQWIGLILIVVFGGATILLHDDRFIMWKPTVLFWIGALVLLISHLSGKNGLKVGTARTCLEQTDLCLGRIHDIFRYCQLVCVYSLQRTMGKLQNVRLYRLFVCFLYRSIFLFEPVFTQEG